MSVPLSPNCVQAGRSQEMPADGSLFGVYVLLMVLPMPVAFDSFSDPFFGAPIAFVQCAMLPRSDAPMTLPVYTMPPGASDMAGKSSVPTILASGVSPRTV